MPTNQVVLISANPRSGSCNREELVKSLQTSLERAGYECEIMTDLQRMSERAKELFQAGRLRTVVSAGGDGTAATVAGLIPNEVPLTLFPTGSENLLAKYFSISANIESSTRAIEKLRTKSLDVMTVNGRIALLMASVGFDAEVVRRVHLARKSHVSRWNYWIAIWTSLLFYRWPKVQITIRDEKDQVIDQALGSWVFVFNVPRYAAGLSIIGDALEDDGCLDVGIFSPGGFLQGLCNYWGVLRGTHHQSKQWRRLRCASIEMDYEDALKAAQPTSKRVTSCQADGDWASELPVLIKITSRKLSIVV